MGVGFGVGAALVAVFMLSIWKVWPCMLMSPSHPKTRMSTWLSGRPFVLDRSTVQ